MNRNRVLLSKAAIFLLFAIASTAFAGVGEDMLNNDPVFQEQEIRSRVLAQQQLEVRRMRAQYEEELQKQATEMQAQCEQALQQMQAQYEQRIADMTAGVSPEQ